jgi:hypothetical protein
MDEDIFTCQQTCFKNSGSSIEKEILKLQNGQIQKIEVPVTIPGYRVFFAPVGNYEDNPYVIISGKTPSKDTMMMFISYLKNNYSLYDASFASIYSNMRNNLFKYLNAIGLFEYLETKTSYWRQNHKDQWDKLFQEPSPGCGIMLTQACNCAVLRYDSGSDTLSSKEPTKNAFDELQEQCGCLFSHFKITTNTKLIVFLDTPDNRFHPAEIINAANTRLKIINITHPSGENNDIYKYLPNLQSMPDSNSKKVNAVKLFNMARAAIISLIQE